MGQPKLQKQEWLDGKEVGHDHGVPLFHDGSHDDPVTGFRQKQEPKKFQGSIVLGMGFTFDDTDKKGVATPLSVMHRSIDLNPNNRDAIFPYIGGRELNDDPNHTHHRYVIDFGEREEAYCRRVWPDLMDIVEDKVKPERIAKDAKKYPKMVFEWWKHWNPRPELRAATANLDRVLAISRVGQQASIAFLPGGMVYADSLIIFPFASYAAYAALQSRPHEIWARFFASSMKDDLRYTPSDCFETFPFPEGWEKHPLLEQSGKEYYKCRAKLMLENNEGLTKTYNRFHDPVERSPKIAELRRLHAAMDRAVLDAYGWADISMDCEFLLDYEIDEEEWGRKKKPLRYRWPDEVRDDVLAKLMALNAQRAQEERLAGLKS